MGNRNGPRSQEGPPKTPHPPRLGRADSLSPDSADAARGQRPGHDLRALLHEAPHGEPEAVAQRILVLQDVGARPQAWVRVVPLVGAQPVERHSRWEEREQERERATMIRRDRKTHMERKRDTDEQRQTHTQTVGAKEEEDRRTRRGEAWRGPRSRSQRHREETQRWAGKGEGRAGAGNPRLQVEPRQSGQTGRSAAESPASASAPPPSSQAAGSGLTWQPGTGRN